MSALPKQASHQDEPQETKPCEQDRFELPEFYHPSDAECIFNAAQLMFNILHSGKPLTSEIMRSAMEDAFGASDADGDWHWKDAYEASEIAQVMMLQRFGKSMLSAAKSPQAFLKMIIKLADLVPTQTKRSDEMLTFQQFSTPLPLAAIAALIADLSSSDHVLEPSAGTGIMAVFAQIKGATISLNELAEKRNELLRLSFKGLDVTNHDAASIDDRLDRSITPNVILMNPPFSKAPMVKGRFKLATSQHVLSALSRLEENGRLIAITGESFSPSTKSYQSAFRAIQSMGQIAFSAPISGKLFRSHGTTFDTRLTVIDKGERSTDLKQDQIYHPMVEDYQALLDLVLKHCPARVSQTSSVSSSLIVDAENKSTSNIASIKNKARAQAMEEAQERAKHPFDRQEPYRLTYEAQMNGDAENKDNSAVTDSVYENYKMQAINIDNAAEHPTALVQSSAMASVAPPVPTHEPLILKSILDDSILSGPQLESVIYAGEAHSKHLSGWFKHSEIQGQLEAAQDDDEDKFKLRRGWFLGDGTGCGKGRQVAGIILDNWLHGRKRAVWVSKSDKLLEDARRDWMAIGGKESDIVPLAKFKQGNEIKLDQGILFVTYATLRSAERQHDGEIKASRLSQIFDWLGPDFDGVIAFDEGHAMANAAAQKTDRGDGKASQQGLAGLAFQNLVPDARVLYVSATGATVVSNLAYASRLGLWGTGDFPFKTRAEFVASMEAGGIAAMEIISRDLKALGLYLARSLSYAGVEYEMLVHELTMDQVEIYDSYADAFQIIHNNLEKALEATGITSDGGTLNRNAKSAARSAFESNKQRFFNHLITAMKCPSLIKSIEQNIEDGHSAVIQVVSTSEALMERRLADIPASEWNDLHVDITPREYVMDYLMHSFPVALFEVYEDEDGEIKSKIAYDTNGNPIICRAAEQARDDLIERLGVLAPVQSALDQILWHFGVDNVAEVTGRKRRIIKSKDERLQVANRPASSNLDETRAFMDDEKKILIFSDAGGTGRSYHADLGAKNQRMRVHYLLEPGWKADNAIQGLGRTNRTNQAQPPLFRPCATNVKGEKRFLSTIARRLDTLGAITKGQRETGGQNMFRAEDNLESSYARAALRQFYHKLKAGKIPACSLERFEQMTGLKLLDEDGCLKEVLPPIQQFLNRCLALTIQMQDGIFEAFGEFLDAIIDGARKSGTLDVGLETLRGEKFEIVDRIVIYEDPETGSKTTALPVERTERNRPLSLNKAIEFCKKHPKTEFYWNKTSKRAAILVPATAFMDAEGVPIIRIELIRPMANDVLELTEFNKSNWEAIDDQMFEHLWTEELKSIPEFTTSKLTLVTGLLLPIWDRLPRENMKIFRLQTHDGEKSIGRLLSQDQLINVFSQLGLDCEIKLTPEDVIKTVMDARNSLILLSNCALRRSLVMGKPRLELSGANSSMLTELMSMGCFTEIIQWKTRVFIPTNDMKVLTKVLTVYPVGTSGKAAVGN